MLLAWSPVWAQDIVDEEEPEVVVVTATRSASPRGSSPVAVEVITREEIEATGAERLDELLEEQPGLQLDTTVTGTAIRMQGMNPEHTLVLVDGQRLLGRKDGVLDLTRFSVDDIERVEIVKGPSSALYGSDAMGGVVHIITRSPQRRPEGGVHLRVGTLGRFDGTADLRAGSKRVQHKVDVGYHRSNAWDLDPSDEGTTASAYSQLGADYAVRLHPSDDVQLDASISWMQRRQRGIQSPASGGLLDTRSFIDDNRGAVGGWWTPTATTKLSARLSGSWFRSQFLTDQRDAKASDTYADDREQLAEAMVQLDQQIGEHFLTVGVDGLAQFLRSDRIDDETADRQRAAVFGQGSFTFSDAASGMRWTLLPGIRLTGDTQFGGAVTPRLATSLQLEDVTVRASIGTGFRAPDFRELYLLFENPGVGYVVQGNPDLEPERSTNYSLSVDATPTSWSSISGQVYVNQIQNLISTAVASTAPIVYTYENVDRATTRGFDLQASVSPGPLHLEAGYAYVYARDLTRERSLPNRVPHRLTSSVRVDLPTDLMVRAQAGWSSPQPYYVDVDGDGVEDEQRIPSQVTLDLRAAWKLGPVEPFLGVDNLLNTGTSAFAPRVPRFFYVGINARLRAKEG